VTLNSRVFQPRFNEIFVLSSSQVKERVGLDVKAC
jgi:hypothetical protein